MAAKVNIPVFETTALDAIPEKAKKARDFFETHATKDLEWRKTQLRKLYWAVEDHKDALLEALTRDLHKAPLEAYLSEIEWVKNDCMFALKHLDAWAKDQKLGAPDVPLAFSMMRLRIRKEPLGAVLIIGPYNFPVNLSLAPLVGAISAGNTAVLKPSENTPNCAMVLKQMVETRLDPRAFHVVNGAVPETNALMNEKWDKVFFTGSGAVGAIIAKKAAETLTPVCLELGGRNPAFVTKKANLEMAARRLLWGKSHNAGQVCVSQNYVLVDKDVVDTFIRFLNAQYKVAFPRGAKASPDLSRIVNARHFQRIKKMLDSTKGKIVMGGQVDESELFIEPTAVLVNSVDDAMMTEESFGPVFAIYPYETLDEALQIARGVHRTPLALFSFGSKAENQKVLNEMTSGGATLNDGFLHGSINTIPFGGVGDSGWGAYRGRASFDCFTHCRTVADTPNWADGLMRVRYAPYDMKQFAMLQWLQASGPDFDRNGRQVKGLRYWLGMLFGLGAKGGKGALMRWLAAVVAAVGSYYYYYVRG